MCQKIIFCQPKKKKRLIFKDFFSLNFYKRKEEKKKTISQSYRKLNKGS